MLHLEPRWKSPWGWVGDMPSSFRRRAGGSAWVRSSVSVAITARASPSSSWSPRPTPQTSTRRRPAADHQHRTSGTVRRWAAMGGLIVIVIALAGTVILSGSGSVKNAAGPSGSRLASVSVASVNTVAENVIGAGQTVLHHVRASQGHHRVASEHRRAAPSKPNRPRAVVQASPISTDYRTVPASQAPSVVTQPARPVYQAQPTSYRPVSRASASARAAGPTGQGTLVGPASCGC